MLRSSEITKALIRDCMNKGHIMQLPNVYFGRWEMDLYSVTRAQKVYEFEIKTSRSDFFADFKKVKKHKKLQDKTYWANRFIYVVPKGLVEVEEVPDYAGLYWITWKSKYSWNIVVKKKPPLINNKDHYTKRVKQLLNKVYHRYIYSLLKTEET